MKTEGNITTLTREELYDLVWAKPVVRLAKEFGISNVAVAKACRRHKIPLPGRGYWRQLETGKKVSRQPLPKDGGKLSPMVVFNAGLSTYLKPPPDEQLKDKIIVPDEPEELHVLARQALIRLTREPVDNHGLTIPIETLDIRVSEPQLSRAVRIMDTLIKRLELLGHNVEIRSHNTEAKYGKPSQIVYTTHVRIEEEALGFAIEESAKRVPHIFTKMEEREIKQGHKWKVPEYDYAPTGNIAFRIRDPYPYGLRSLWSEGKRHLLEDLVSSFIQGLVAMAHARIERELERKRRQQRQEEAERLRREEEERRRQEEARIKRLESELSKWRLVRQAREYLAELKKRMPENCNPKTREWIDWIHFFIEQSDPFRRLFEG